MSGNLVSLLIVLGMSGVLAYSGIKKAPGIGIILSLLGVLAAILLGHTSLAGIGFSPQENWKQTLTLGLALGAGIALLASLLIDPFAEKLTGIPHDISIVDSVRGNLKALLVTILLIWVTVAFMEEILFRGFLMTELANVLGRSTAALTVNILLTALVFGLAHWYQGKSGVISTGIISILISLIFVLSGFNLWLVILVHGFIDTIALALIYRGWDTRMKQVLWRG
jgi:membrane protease YdiL (CAAX protease family)